MTRLKQLISLFIVGCSTIVASSTCCNKKVKEVKINNKIVFEDSLIKENSIKGAASDETSILVKLNYETEPIDFTGIDEEELDNYRNVMFHKQKEFHESKNQEMISKLNLGVLNDIYISSYAPYFSFTSNYEELVNNDLEMLNELASSENVEQIIISKQQLSNSPNLEMAKKFVGARTIINNKEVTGKGIVVGLLEPGILNKNHDNFSTSDIEVLSGGTVTDHATIMGSIIAGKSGISQEAKLLSVELNGDPVSEIDWLLNKGVNVINCSYSDKTADGIYSSKSAYMDYIVENYKVTIVTSAGNTGTSNQYVANPGLGYNVITVGACSNTDNKPRSFSSYKVQQGPSKPNILAPGYSMNVYPLGLQEGTSVSAAFTTGCVALLMEKHPTIKYHPELVRTLLMTYTNKVDGYKTTNALNNIVGAGSLNFEDSYNGLTHCMVSSNTSTQPNLKLTAFCLNLKPGQTVRAALSWLAHANGKADGTNISEYDIVIENSLGEVVSRTNTKNDNVAFIEYTVTKEDTYDVWMVQGEKFVSSDSIAIAYKVI